MAQPIADRKKDVPNLNSSFDCHFGSNLKHFRHLHQAIFDTYPTAYLPMTIGDYVRFNSKSFNLIGYRLTMVLFTWKGHLLVVAFTRRRILAMAIVPFLCPKIQNEVLVENTTFRSKIPLLGQKI